MENDHETGLKHSTESSRVENLVKMELKELVLLLLLFFH